MNNPSLPNLEKRDWIAGLEKGLAVIEAVDDANPRMTASHRSTLYDGWLDAVKRVRSEG